MGGWALSFDARRRRAGSRDAGRNATAGIARGGAMRLSRKCHERDYNAARGADESRSSDDSTLARRAVRDARTRTRLESGAARHGVPPGREDRPGDAG